MYKNTGAVTALQKASAAAGIEFSDELLWATSGSVTLKYGPNVEMSTNPIVASFIDEANRLVFGAPLKVGNFETGTRKAVGA